MEKYYFEKELKEAVLIKSNEKPVTMVLNGEEVEVCCPELCSMNIAENGSPCLVSEDKASNDKKVEFGLFHWIFQTGKIRTGSVWSQLSLKMQWSISLPITIWKKWLVDV